MTATAIPGTTVPIPAVLRGPESAQENVRNALMLLRGAYVDGQGVRELTADEYLAVCTRLQWAVDQLEHRA